MINYLFTIEHFYPICDASGNCLKNLLAHFDKTKICIHILQINHSDFECESLELEKNVFLHSFKVRKSNFFSKIMRKINIFAYPGYKKNIAKKYLETKKKLCDLYKFDCCFDVFYPFENVIATIKSDFSFKIKNFWGFELLNDFYWKNSCF